MSQEPGDRQGRLALALLAALSALLVALVLVPFLKPLLFAAVLAVAFEPLYEKLLRLLRSTALAALVATLVIVVLVLAPLGLIAVNVIQEAGVVYQAAAHHSSVQGGWSVWLTRTIEQPVQWMAQKTGLPAPDVKAALLDQAQSLVKTLAGWGASLLTNVTRSLANALLGLLILFFLFLEGPKISAALYEWSPLPREKTAQLLVAVRESIVANVYGIVAVALVQGLLTSLGFLFTGLGAPVFWGVVAAFCSLIPVAGTALVWLPAAVFLLVQGTWGKALFLALWGALVVGMSDNFVRPWVLSGRTGMSGLLVFFALMGGMQAFGAIGIFAGPVIFSTAAAVFRMLREESGRASAVTSSEAAAAGPDGPVSPRA